MKIRIKPLLTSLVANSGPVAPILLALAIGSATFAASSIGQAAVSIKQSQVAHAQSVALKKEAIDEKTATMAAQELAKLAPTIGIAVAGRYVVVSVEHLEQFAEWMHALTTVQSFGQDLIWEAEDICLASCEGGMSARAYVTAYRRHIEVK